MAMEILRDARVRSVPWHDLARLTRLETSKELTISLPWLAGSLYLAHRGLWLAALALSFVFFLTGLRVVHDAFHENLGLPRAATEAVLFALSIAMLGSMHAVKWNHLRHHKHCMSDEDVEAHSARMSAARALLWGPVFPLLLHATAWRQAGARTRRWILAELCVNTALGVAALAVPVAPLRYHVGAMALGQCFTAFFAVWTVHRDCDRSHYIARTLRNRFKSAIAFNMFFHVEHHLFPKVPTCHLPTLAERLDASAPELSRKQVY